MAKRDLIAAIAVIVSSCSAAAGSSSGRQVRADYIGCFLDNVGGVRDISGFAGVTQWSDNSMQPTKAVSSSMTVQLCSSICSLGGFSCMGLQSGIGCYCGNSYGSQGAAAPVNCSSACGGNASQTCGGNSRNSVHALTYLDQVNFGMWSDRPGIAVSGSYTQQLNWALSANCLTRCAILCDASCQAFIFNSEQSLCHLLKFSLVPSALSGVAGDFYSRG